MRKFVIADIHGANKALLQCLERSGFNKETDQLICLGDYVDGWSESIEVIQTLQNIPNVIKIIGNHDHWFINYVKHGATPYIWISQGGQATIDSFIRNYDDNLTDQMLKFFSNAVYYYVDDGNLFVHGGYDWHHQIEGQMTEDLMWDRHLADTSAYWQHLTDKGHKHTTNFVKDYKQVFLGHTTVRRYKKEPEPMFNSNVILLDTGGGWEGKLTIMDVDTLEYWQSDLVSELYPEEKGRG